MICGIQTNKVYLAEGIKGYPKVAENLLMALCDEGIDTDTFPRPSPRNTCGHGPIYNLLNMRNLQNAACPTSGIHISGLSPIDTKPPVFGNDLHSLV